MVEPIQAIGAAQSFKHQSPGPVMEKPARDVAEARRLIQQNKIRGAEATRILTLATQAEQKIGNGAFTEAERLSKEALDQAKELAGPPIPNAPTPVGGQSEDSGGSSASSQTPEVDDETPLAKEVRDQNSNIFQRETTTYADGSDDQGISFQYAQPLTPAQSSFAVRQHELSHVRRETSDAIINGQRVLTSVTINSQVDPGSGQQVIRGGNARIMIFPNIEFVQPEPFKQTGQNLDKKG